MDQMPLWGQVLVGALLIVFSILSTYGRINPKVGAKVFSKIPESEIRTNKAHILSYTIIPIVVTIGYLVVFLNKYFIN
jgi:hypothetical protein